MWFAAAPPDSAGEKPGEIKNLTLLGQTTESQKNEPLHRVASMLADGQGYHHGGGMGTSTEKDDTTSETTLQ
ncbi:hypothetical protein RRG08_025082 [Elysia crispata]|uniref:Uncharacterized protein n=1 Tax=Elysia crispata TaxID=231223 RepID=A0AAE1DZT1_9GAST|nr:hypothetical protein RRG08_025082 [Elysia crispata]